MAQEKVRKPDSALILAIAYVVIGILFCIFKGEVISWIMTAAGVLFIVQGILHIVAKRTTEGIINIVIGAVILLCGWLLLKVALIIFGVLIAASGVLNLIQMFKGGKLALIPLIVAIATIAVGVLLVVSQWVVFDVMFIIIGVLFIVDGAIGIFNSVKK
ncbi:MAG: DUF308 domain-containing protein [Clostridia bacterium]|nr:DUF308 domain-containing protein [Clostridia bacterium]